MGSAPSFTARVETRNGVGRILLRGELDTAAVPLLKEHVENVEQSGVAAIVLDLRDLTFIDGSGLRAFGQAKTRASANGHRLLVIGASPATRRLFELTRTEYLLDDEEVVSVLAQFTSPSGLGDGRAAPMDGDSGA
jgi:anti-sigma B factor antagonist